MHQREKVIIIGGGMAGKLAARVLSDVFQEVIILEKDSETLTPAPRNGVPQGKHIHALLHAGEHGLEKLFPGVTDCFHSSGAVKINSTKDLAWYHHGVWKFRYDGGYTTTLQTRPHLEWHIDQHIHKISNIKVLYNHSVTRYVYQDQENRIAGVEGRDSSDSRFTLLADLVVDASGASSLSSRWFNAHDIHIPTDKVEIGLTYASQLVELPDNKNRDWKIKLLYPNPPAEKIAGSISNVEGNRYLVTFIGYHDEIDGKEILKDERALLELARKLPKSDIHEELQTAKALSSVSVFRVPHILWRKVDKAQNLPEGLLLIGDSLCRIDPFFGQGMSIAVLEALALQDIFQNQQRPQQKSINAFHKKAGNIIAPIWNMVLTEDFRYPATKGKKPFGLPFLQWYAKNIFLLSSENPKIYDGFIKVMNLKRPMTILMHPKILIRVLKRTK
ncbi:FAD-dependent monooxygenase [Bacillus sp. FJAT-27251]|uniref:FAD-dependent oxidoreductase n=1 Tax=Bacillus sp. FJAT-27251 TaxID=1684142 RepID=UPI0006A7968A|nr:FAD-dependent monooxygenase [Bacillus sp. FJAT-27251]